MSRHSIGKIVERYPDAGSFLMFGEKLDDLSREELMACICSINEMRSGDLTENLRRLERRRISPFQEVLSGP